MTRKDCELGCELETEGGKSNIVDMGIVTRVRQDLLSTTLSSLAKLTIKESDRLSCSCGAECGKCGSGQNLENWDSVEHDWLDKWIENDGVVDDGQTGGAAFTFGEELMEHVWLGEVSDSAGQHLLSDTKREGRRCPFTDNDPQENSLIGVALWQVGSWRSVKK